MDTKSTKHCRYNINYHFVWCPKYRHPILVADIAIHLKELITQICDQYKFALLELEIMPDRIHLFLSAPTQIAPTEILKTPKSISAVKIFHAFPNLKKQKFWGSGLWSDGYYVGTAATVTAETIQKYIQEQKSG